MYKNIKYSKNVIMKIESYLNLLCKSIQEMLVKEENGYGLQRIVKSSEKKMIVCLLRI